MENQAYVNTDRELWRAKPGDFYADSIFVTEGDGIGINCGGYVLVASVRAWFDCGVKLLTVNPELPSWRRRLGMWLLGYKEHEHITDGRPCWCNPVRVSYRDGA